MLKARVIPCLDVKDGRVVKGSSFVNLRDAGDPVEQAIIYDKEGADDVRIQYGGSVKPDNIEALMSEPEVDGALVGGAALKPDSFAGIVNGANKK